MKLTHSGATAITITICVFLIIVLLVIEYFRAEPYAFPYQKELSQFWNVVK